MTTRWILLLAPLTVVVATVAVHRSRSVPTTSGEPAPGPIVAEATAASTLQPLSREGWRPGKRHSYRLSFSTTFESAAGRYPVLQLEADLVSTVLAADSGAADVEWKLSSLVAQDAPNGGASSGEGRTRLLAALSLPFVVSYDAEGRPLTFRFDPRGAAEAKGFLKEIVSSVQFARSSSAAQSWTTLEHTPAGDVEARYTPLSAPRQFARRRLGRKAPAPAGGGVPAQSVMPAQSWLALGEDGRIERAVTSQRYELAVPGTEAKLATVTNISLSLRSTGEAPVPLRAFVTDAVAEPVAAASEVPRDAETVRLRGILGSATLPDLLRQAADRGVLADDKRRRGVARRLGALVSLTPGALVDVVAGARGAGDRRPFVAALAESGSPPAQAALAAMATDAGLARDARLSAVDALGSIRKPTRQAQAALDEARRDTDPEVRKSAALGLGAAAYHAVASDPEGARRGVEALRDQLRAARTKVEIVDALDALGNTGSPDALDDLAAALRSTDNDVRAAAAGALRLIPGTRSERLIADTIVTDPAAEVRIAALFAAEFHPLAPLVESVQAVCRGGAGVEVRQAATAVLAAAVRRGEEALAVPLLSWIAQHDPSADLRALAAAHLEA